MQKSLIVSEEKPSAQAHYCKIYCCCCSLVLTVQYVRLEQSRWESRGRLFHIVREQLNTLYHPFHIHHSLTLVSKSLHILKKVMMHTMKPLMQYKPKLSVDRCKACTTYFYYHNLYSIQCSRAREPTL